MTTSIQHLPVFMNAYIPHRKSVLAPIIALGDGTTYKTLGGARGLLPCDDWDEAEFRFPTSVCDIACNVEVTGRKPIWLGSRGTWIRIKVTFVGDGEPDEVVRGYGRLA